MDEKNQSISNSVNNTYETYNPKGIQFASASLVFGIMSIACGIFLFWTPFVFLGFVGGGLAILFAVLSKGNYKKMEPRAKKGFIFGIIGPVVSAITLSLVIISTFYMLRTDDTLREEARQAVKDSEEVLKSIYGEEYFEEYEAFYGKELNLELTFDQLFGE